MTQSEMRAVHRLVAADVVEITDDVRLFRVLKIEKASSDQGARCKVHLCSMDGQTHVMLLRGGRELIRCISI
jgi:hypothetical protein